MAFRTSEFGTGFLEGNLIGGKICSLKSFHLEKKNTFFLKV